MLKIKNLNVSYGSIKAIRNIDININSGETVCLIGSNGAGKSSLLNAISMLISYEGTIVFKDKEIKQYTTTQLVESGLVMVPEGRRIFSKLTVVENLEMGGFVLKDKRKRMTMIEKYLSMFPILSERKNQLAGNLSGGEQQMLAMARALMSSPSLLLLDEPTMGLSPVMVLKLFEIIKKIREEGTTILLVEQNAKIAIKLCDRGYVMNNGEITMSGSSPELENNEQIKEAYLGV
ncbi:MAG: ABC transporter ATP-binding protein [Hydrogenophilales bacterium]